MTQEQFNSLMNFLLNDHSHISEKTKVSKNLKLDINGSIIFTNAKTNTGGDYKEMEGIIKGWCERSGLDFVPDALRAR